MPLEVLLKQHIHAMFAEYLFKGLSLMSHRTTTVKEEDLLLN